MANKPASRNWNDVQLFIATASMAATLAFWNQFGAPDREAAMKRAQERAALLPPPPVQVSAPAAPVNVSPTLQSPTVPTGPILLGGSAPQTTIIIQKGGGGGGGGEGGGGGGGGGGGATSTGSS
jgi:hypothetical protein